MEHLSLEALARLVDETPFRRERRHLARCPDCSRELELLREQTEALKALPDLRPAPGDWPALEARLEEEGLLHKASAASAGLRFTEGLLRRPGRPAAPDIRSFAPGRGWMQAAAAVVLFVAGGFSGAALAPGSGPGTGLGGDIALSEVATAEQAAEYLQLAEQQYYDAMRHYRELSPTMEAEAPMDVRRLAAMDGIVAASQAAVQEAPYDPYLNGFLVSAVAERDAAMNTLFAAANRY